MGTTGHPTAAKANQVRVAMQQKTDGRVVRLLTKYVGAEGRPIEQWFLVAIGDDDKATGAVAKSANAVDAVFEVIGHIPRRHPRQLGHDGGRGPACASR